MNPYVIGIAIIMALTRMSGHKSEAFQAFAHLFVGWLIGGAYFDYRHTWDTGGKRAIGMMWTAIALSIVEITCFVYFKYFSGG